MFRCGRRSCSSQLDDPARPVPIDDMLLDPCYDCVDELLSLSAGRAECLLCFDDLCAWPCAVFEICERGMWRRSCRHFIHENCAAKVRSHGITICPICRADFSRTRRVPTLADDAAGFFLCADIARDGRLSIREIADILPTQLPLALERFEQELPRLYRRWDLDGTGGISRGELTEPGALFDFARWAPLRAKQGLQPSNDEGGPNP